MLTRNNPRKTEKNIHISAVGLLTRLPPVSKPGILIARKLKEEIMQRFMLKPINRVKPIYFFTVSTSLKNNRVISKNNNAIAVTIKTK